MRKIRGINKDKIKLNIIDKEKTVGYKNYRYKSHSGIVGLIVFLICLIPELNIDIKAALIMFPVIVFLWDVITYLIFIWFIKHKHKQNAKFSDHMRD